MNEAAPAIFVALEDSALGHAIRQSTWAYLAANVGHIVSLVVFAGAVAVMDLRLAGAFAATSPGFVLRAARRVAIIAFLGLAGTGALLFTAEASHVILNPVFQLKLGLIALGLANIALFEFFAAPKIKDLPPLTPLPGSARAAGMLSIAVWIAVAICGRSIAYF
ncbi:MAG: hypothetical protein M3R18_08805 [Pseudomonadota bacterium]|nr:hypothetical protein [Pseudomonadota bacterium]